MEPFHETDSHNQRRPLEKGGDRRKRRRNMEHGLATFQIFVPISMAPGLEPNLKANKKPMLSENLP